MMLLSVPCVALCRHIISVACAVVSYLPGYAAIPGVLSMRCSFCPQADTVFSELRITPFDPPTSDQSPPIVQPETYAAATGQKLCIPWQVRWHRVWFCDRMDGMSAHIGAYCVCCTVLPSPFLQTGIIANDYDPDLDNFFIIVEDRVDNTWVPVASRLGEGSGGASARNVEVPPSCRSSSLHITGAISAPLLRQCHQPYPHFCCCCYSTCSTTGHQRAPWHLPDLVCE